MATSQALRPASRLLAPARVAAIPSAAAGALVLCVAFVARLAVVVSSSGGFGGRTGYDTGVYYSAAAALVHGRLPYRDYTLIHPPAITLLLSPFAAIGSLTSDHLGFVLAMLAAMSVGAASALLVLLIGRRAGLGRLPSLAGALFYAVAYPAVTSEFTPRLEPFGNVFVLLGVLAFVTAGRRHAPALAALCGAALAVATSIKIWYVVPLVVIALWTSIERRGRRQGLLIVAGAGAAFAAIDGPFFVLAPTRMFHLVILDQLGRPRMPVTVRTRLEVITGLPALGLHGAGRDVVLCTAALLAALIGARACRTPLGRLAVALFVAETVTLLVAPSFFGFYADYAMTGAALLITAAAGSLRRADGSDLPGRAGPIALAALLGMALTTLVALAARPSVGPQPFPAQELRQAVAGAACVQADEPSTLIALDVLSRDLRDGCPLWVDVTGRTYGVDAARGAGGNTVPRPQNTRWQHALRRYLRAGNAVILTRRATGLDARTWRAVTRGGVLGSSGGYHVFDTAHRPHREADRFPAGSRTST